MVERIKNVSASIIGHFVIFCKAISGFLLISTRVVISCYLGVTFMVTTASDTEPQRGVTSPPVGSVGDQMRALVPAEVTAVFLSLDANFKNREDYNIWFLWFFIVLMFISLFYSRYFVKNQGWSKAALVSFVIFPAWALMISYDRIDILAANPPLVTGIMLILGLVVPFAAAVHGRGLA